jgi:hypothetical protein
MTIDKTVTQAPVSAASAWTVTYQVAVSNVGPIATTYDLTDVPTFGAGVTITKMSSGALEDTIAPFSLQLATGRLIAPTVTDIYTVTVTFTVAGSATSADLDCQLISGESGTGTLNTATATYNGNTIQDTDCAPIQDLIIDKVVSSLVASQSGQATVVYSVAVSNVGPVATTYDLSDTPAFGANTTVTNIAVSSTPPAPAVNILSYQAGAPIVTNVPIDPGITHVYTVTVDFTIGAEITELDADCELVTGEQGTGTLNRATAVYSGGTIEDSDCAPVPFGGGAGAGGGGGGQPPTDMLLPTDSASAMGGSLDGSMGWILWILLTAAAIISGGMVIRRVRTSEI